MTIVRGQQVMAFPTRFMLVAASNPCPCGMGDDDCRCSAADLARHHRRLSGPLLDRIDVLLAVGRPTAGALRDEPAPPSAAVRERVSPRASARPRRLSRYGLTLQRADDAAAAARASPARRRARCGCSTSSTTATACQRARPRPRAARRAHARRPRRERRHRPRPHHDRRRPAPREPASPGDGGMTGACDACLRRTALIAALSGLARRRVAPARRRRPACSRCPTRTLLAIATPGDPPRATSASTPRPRTRPPRSGPSSRACAAARPRIRRGCATLPDPPAVLHMPATRRRVAVDRRGRDRRRPPRDALRARGRADARARPVARRRAVVSGLALGVDSAAHQGALEGHGPAGRRARRRRRPVAYPASQARAARRRGRARRGRLGAAARASASTAGPSSRATGSIAALAQVVVVVEATERSGSLTTADFAADLGRTVAAVPGRVTCAHRGGHERPDPRRRRARARQRRRARRARRGSPARPAGRPPAGASGARARAPRPARRRRATATRRSPSSRRARTRGHAPSSPASASSSSAASSAARSEVAMSAAA